MPKNPPDNPLSVSCQYHSHSGQYRSSNSVQCRTGDNAEGGTSGRLPADQNSYTIDKLRSGTSYDITVTVVNPAGNSSTTFTRSTEGGARQSWSTRQLACSMLLV
ncbi:hypothetical protein GBAR_LOCUS107 [Geodia barretti]|uniref:Fibronectin type-III domain-containing protein n=1 Tax=Geodia barretti TaxID=519541 RepID=A0AA35QS40_GEOBA|nr:hypothetical protein GBAR_LOCUS107 [Geodia barretti]